MTAFARPSDSFKLYASAPSLSVWPSIETLWMKAFSLITETISSSRSSDSGLIVALLVSNWILSLMTILSAVTSTRLGLGGGSGFATGGGGGAGGVPVITSALLSENA